MVIYYKHGSLIPLSDEPAQYAQLFIYDPAYATNLRHRRSPDLDLEVLGTLTEMLHRINPYIPLYKTAREILQDRCRALILRVYHFQNCL